MGIREKVKGFAAAKLAALRLRRQKMAKEAKARSELGKIGADCPRCSRKLVVLKMHKECYGKFALMSHINKRNLIADKKREAAMCPVCRAAGNTKHFFCGYCGFFI